MSKGVNSQLLQNFITLLVKFQIQNTSIKSFFNFRIKFTTLNINFQMMTDCRFNILVTIVIQFNKVVSEVVSINMRVYEVSKLLKMKSSSVMFKDVSIFFFLSVELKLLKSSRGGGHY